MTTNYEHLRTPSAYDTMIRPLLAAKEAVEANLMHTVGLERLCLEDLDYFVAQGIEALEMAHRWDGDKRRN